MSGAPEEEASSEPAGDAEGPSDETAGEEGLEDEEEEHDERTVDAPAGRRRVAPLLLVAGLAIAFVVGRQALPTSREVVVRLEGDRADVRSVGLSVGAVADGDEEISSVQWRYEATRPVPKAMRTEVKLPRGAHRFRVDVVRATGERTETNRVIEVSDGAVTINAPTR